MTKRPPKTTRHRDSVSDEEQYKQCEELPFISIESDKKASGIKKVECFLGDLVYRNDFDARVVAIRNLLKIPPKGFPLITINGEKQPTQEFPQTIKRELWEYLKENGEKDFPLPLSVIADSIAPHILFNTPLQDPRWSVTNGGLCAIAENDSQFFPISVLISPVATKRDILTFLSSRKTWRHIQHLQSKHPLHKSDVGRHRTKNPLIQKRNAFIYQHRRLPLATVASMLRDKFIGNKEVSIQELKTLEALYALEESAIATIIAQERKRRHKPIT